MPNNIRTEQQKKEIADQIHELRKEGIQWQYIFKQLFVSHITGKKIYREIYKEEAL